MQVNFIELFGNASKSSMKIYFESHELTMTVLNFLQLKQIAIASSCRGRSSCKKCMLSNGALACEYTLKEYIKTFGNKVPIDYI